MQGTSPDPLARALAGSPALFPFDWDAERDELTLLRLGEAELRAASFLDDRVRVPGMATRTVAANQISELGQILPEYSQFIFHIGHVGSTLLSRLLGSHRDVLALREPLVLRRLALAEGLPPARREARTALFLALLSRRFRQEQIPIIKATSYASELAKNFLLRPARPKSIFLTVPPEVFLASILGGENTPREAQMLSADRLVRLGRRAGARIKAPTSPGETAALGWATEMAALAAAARAAPDQVQWLDFDRFLSDPVAGLDRCFAHLGISASEADIAAIVAGPELGRYAKAPEFAYGPEDRRARLDEARQKQGVEIARGLAWLERMARDHAAVGAAWSAV